jgi:hypothetical protein
MKLKALLSVTSMCAFLVPGASLASDPPPIPDHLMPPASRPQSVQKTPVAPRAIPDPGPPMTLERLKKLPVSGVLYGEMYRKVKEENAGKRSATSGITAGDQGSRGAEEDISVISEASSVTATARATNDTRQDVEPAVTVVNVSGTTYTASTSIKYVPIVGLTGNRPRVYYSTTSDFASFVSGLMPIPTGYQLTGDPLMSTNPYTGGIAPKRVYCTGLLFNTGTTNAPSAIGVWRSDDGGRTWSYPAIVASQAGGGYMVDKPAITVSWHAGSLGYVYVSWVNVDVSGTNSIWVARSTDGGLTFPTSTVISYASVTGPQVTVNANNGDVHVMWFDLGNNDLRFSMSTNLGVNFGPHEIISGGNLVGITNLNGGVRAPSLPMARYNWVANRLAVVWHANGGAGAGTDIYYSYRPCSSQCNFQGWELPQRVNDSVTGDQFMPAVDFNSSGNLLIPFYDRRDDGTQNILYHHYVAEVGPSGNALDINRRVSTFQSDPRRHTATTGSAGFIGDYHDVWSFTYPEGERLTSVWIGIPSTTIGESYLSKIAY